MYRHRPVPVPPPVPGPGPVPVPVPAAVPSINSVYCTLTPPSDRSVENCYTFLDKTMKSSRRV